LKKILLTGSSGFIGKHLTSHLEKQGHVIIPADRRSGIDLTIKSTVDFLPDVDIVLHFAALNGTKHFYNRPMDVIRDSVLSTQYLLDRYAGKIERFIFTGTCESYAGAVDQFDWKVPTDETVPLVISDVTNPRWSYGGSKMLNELQVLAGFHQFNQEFTIIRYHNIYGPGQVDHIIPDFIERARKNNFVLDGWKNTRSFMYIDDAIDVTTDIIFNPKCANEILNVGNDNEISIRELALIILDEMGISGELTLRDAPKGSVTRRCPNISKLKKLTGFVSKIDVREGIRKILN
jgi:nucleoside-diphosphate-sugar epimerase